MFDFSDLNMQVMPDDMQMHHYGGGCPQYSIQPCFCHSRPIISVCRCLSSPITCKCLSQVISYCKCLTRPNTLCICLSKPIASVPPRTLRDFTIYEQVTAVTREVNDIGELEVLRTELQEAMKHVEVQREVLARTAGPQSDSAFDEAENALKQQLEQVQRQRAEFRKLGGGGTDTGKK